jgi:predicted anti-sigma-YlaC factor YlaD
MNTMSSMITCRQAVNYISKKEEGRLSATQRFALWRHLGECSLCRTFSAQNKIIIQAFTQPLAGTAQLTQEEKDAIIKTVLQQSE